MTRGTPGEAELDEALWAARRAVALTPRSTCWDTLAEVLFRKGDLPGAIAAAREAIRLNPQMPQYRERMRTLCADLPPFMPDADPGDTSTGETEEEIFDDEDFCLKVNDLDSDDATRTDKIDLRTTRLR